MTLLNWPPSRGPNPHTHEWKLTPGVTRKDMPAPKPRASAVVEKGIIEKASSGTFLGLSKINFLKNPNPGKRWVKDPKKPLLEGSWRVWYQVESVAGLTVEQADEFVLGCQEKGPGRIREHQDNWYFYEPSPLWVDITYPLTRGVRLLVKPLIKEKLPCKACGGSPVKRPSMSPGYLLWMVAKEYQRIYQEHEKYGVWGHALSDLGFERITVRKDGVVELGIGS